MNVVSYFNKHLSQMLASYFHLFCYKAGFQCFVISCCFVVALSACTQQDKQVTQIKLGDWTINDAEFSNQGHLALTVGQDIAVYNHSGALLHLLNLPQPNGIWQLNWQDKDRLWVYDQYHLYQWFLGENTVAEPFYTHADKIRHVQTMPGGLFVATETGALLWFSDAEENTLNVPVEAFSELGSISTLGITAQNQLYIGNTNGELWVWNGQNYRDAAYHSLQQPIHDLFSYKNTLYALTSRYNNPIATNNTLMLWQLQNDASPTATTLEGSTGIFSLIMVNNTLIIGGSNSSWQSLNLLTNKQNSGRIKATSPHQQGRIIAMYEMPNVILMLNSRGELQKWQKARIFNEHH